MIKVIWIDEFHLTFIVCIEEDGLCFKGIYTERLSCK